MQRCVEENAAMHRKVGETRDSNTDRGRRRTIMELIEDAAPSIESIPETPNGAKGNTVLDKRLYTIT